MHRNGTTTAKGRRFRRRGAAMVEFVLALPLLLAVLGLTLFAGWAMVRKQHVVVANRYAVWRSFDTGWPTDDVIRDNVVRRDAAGISRKTDEGPLDALEMWTDAVDDVDPAAGDFASQCLMETWPHGRQIELNVKYDPPIPIAKRFSRQMEFAHGREGRDWVHRQVHPWEVLRDRYYADMDELLAGIGTPGDRLAARVRHLWNARW